MASAELTVVHGTKGATSGGRRGCRSCRDVSRIVKAPARREHSDPPSSYRWTSRILGAALPMIGRRLAHYEILAELGAGGMGVVYKAQDTHLDRLVAIKVLPHDAVSNPDRKLRFTQEAKAASGLNHPCIVTI